MIYRFPLFIAIVFALTATFASYATAQPVGTGHWQMFGLPDGLASIRVQAIVQDRQGSLWFGTDGWGVSRYDGIRLERFTEEDGLPDNRIDAIVEDRQGRIWVLTAEGACQYDGRRFQRISGRQRDEDVSRWEGAMAEDDRGMMWIGTNAGIKPYRGPAVTAGSGLAHNRINAITLDKEDALWIGSNGGLNRYADGVIASYTMQNGLPDTLVTSVVEDRNGSIWIGTPRGAARYNGQRWDVFTTRHGLINNTVHAILEDRDGILWFATDGGVSRFDGKTWTGFTIADGLIDNRVYALLEDHEGYLWFGTDEGVSRYDREQCLTYTREHGIEDDRVTAIIEDREGTLWFGTETRGAMRYRNGRFDTVTRRDGLVYNGVNTIIEDRDGALWFGTDNGVSRYDGKRWQSFTSPDALVHNNVNAILETADGALWFATNRGVSRYDQGTWTGFTIADGLTHNVVWSMLEDPTGPLWFGTAAGVGRYDGQAFTSLNHESSLTHNSIRDMVADKNGGLWFITQTHGIVLYEDDIFTSFTLANGLAGDRVTSVLKDRNGTLWFGAERGVSRFEGEQMNDALTGRRQASRRIRAMLEDKAGHLWFGTQGGGVIHYDNGLFQRMFRQDGLADDTIDALFQDSRENIWIVTSAGITRYRHVETTPPLLMTAAMTDQSHNLSQPVRFPSSQPAIDFEFQGVSFKTRPDQMLYLYQLEGYDQRMLSTRNRRVTYTDLPRGDYTLRVTAVDRDLGTSETIETNVVVHLPYVTLTYLGVFVLVCLLGGLATRSAIHRRRERDLARQELQQTQQQLIAAMERELQTAHDVQMRLLPQEAPAIPGFDLAGRCIPANHVGGDHYTYQWLDEQHQKLAVVIADVAGKEMKAAMTVMRFAEVLYYEVKNRQTPDTILTGLNRSIQGRLEPRLYVTACVGVLDTEAKTMSVSNAGHPPVYHRTGDGQVTELDSTGRPLGLRKEADYDARTVTLQPGDVLVFYSDGTYEARDHMGRDYGFDRLEDTIERVGAAGSAEEILERILSDVKRFVGVGAVEDDITVVVIKVR